ncbi:MAG TPA: hypothetical protein VN446_03335 [Candidatus Acidoferrum sp.]|nr:hypothetical protein [Candidatus Acidoferrum sp.]
MNKKNRIDPKVDEKLIKAAQKSLGQEAMDKVRQMDPGEIDRMLRQISDDDMAKLEAVLKDPNSLSRMMTPENTARIKKILEG